MRVFGLQVLLVIAVACGAMGQEQTNSFLGVTIGGSVYYGHVEGFLQTPKGGNAGTSSRHRPTLEELGIDDTVFYDFQLAVDWRHFEFYGGYQAITLDGSATLSEPLVSHGLLFPAGDEVKSKTDFDWWRIGVGWKFKLADDRLEIMPKGEFALLDFNYNLTDSTQKAKRTYSKETIRLGVDTSYRINRVISLSLSTEGALPISDMPQIGNITGGVEFDLMPENPHVRPKLFIGGGAEWITYEDKQTVPNQFRVDLGPYVTAGLKVAF
jgi:hypothetical protein